MRNIAMNENNVILPGWETVRCIGSGSSGKVYEIRKKDEYGGDFHCALKVISVPATQEEYDEMKSTMSDYAMRAKLREQVEEISNEYRLMGELRGHPNIVNCEDQMIVPHINDAGWDIYIRMELLTSLTDYVHENGITGTQVVQLGEDICSALELCAKNGIIHRDIKPQNIFVSKYGAFKLGDFSVAKSTVQPSLSDKVGTYSYMAPEVFRGNDYTSSVDIYSLGMVLYWLLNDKGGPFLPPPPHTPTDEENASAQLCRYRGEPVPPPRNGNTALKKVVQKACSFRAEERFKTPAEMKKALELAANGKEMRPKAPDLDATVKAGSPTVQRPITQSAPPVQQPKPKPKPKPATPPQPKQTPREESKKKSSIYTVAIVATVILMIFSILLYFALSNGWLKFGGSDSPIVSDEPTPTPYKVTSVYVSSPEIKLQEGEETQLSASFLPEPENEADAPELVWKSSNAAVATVDENGNVTAVKAGTATVMVYVKGMSDICDECTVTVEEPTVLKLEIIREPYKTNYTIGDSLELDGLKVKAYYSNDTEEEIDDLTLLEVSANMNSIGTQTVTVAYNGRTAEFSVWVGLF